MKVWILERFVSAEMLEDSVEHALKIFKHCETFRPSKLDLCRELLANARSYVERYPEGMWQGFEGKVRYNEFCNVAKEAIRRNPHSEFRVVTAEIEDNADNWLGYTNCVVNEGVLKYLRATA